MGIIVLSPRAQSDIAEIWDYIAEDSETRADDFIDVIDLKFQTLSNQPNMGRKRGELAEGLRSFPVGRYVIFYLPIPQGVQIVRVLHGSRDLETIFTDEMDP
jgi:toxin ParE1/3/4